MQHRGYRVTELMLVAIWGYITKIARRGVVLAMWQLHLVGMKARLKRRTVLIMIKDLVRVCLNILDGLLPLVPLHRLITLLRKLDLFIEIEIIWSPMSRFWDPSWCNTKVCPWTSLSRSGRVLGGEWLTQRGKSRRGDRKIHIRNGRGVFRIGNLQGFSTSQGTIQGAGITIIYLIVTGAFMYRRSR